MGEANRPDIPAGVVHAPEIGLPGLDWFNVSAPLTLAALRGKLVILDFWTFCCINCMQVLPCLRRVEEAFPKDVAVIGVHSPKFAAERTAGNVAAAVARYDIRHPVVSDADFRIWRSYAVRAWPTLVFVSPTGYVVGQHSGEPDAERLLAAVGDLIAQYRHQGAMTPSLLPLAIPTGPPARLRFPGKIKRLPGNARIWAVADSGHHQIALLDDQGRDIDRIGSGAPGLVDGSRQTAGFHAPQGLVGDAEAIYVADTGNHAIRRIDRESGTVTTLAGTGERGPGLPGDGTPGRAVALASPWDLEIDAGRLFFANAGSHQLGEIDLRGGVLYLLAGSGAESIVDGPAEEAALAQPSGLTLDARHDFLYFVDSETSSVRRLSLRGERQVETLVGTGLFDFGAQNGAFSEARLQHPLGLTISEKEIVVADSYNGRLRSLHLGARRVSDFDDGFVCADPVCLPFGEPAGVVADGADRLLMADTNNHRIVEFRRTARIYRTWAA